MSDKHIQINMSYEEAEQLQYGVADMLCFISGYKQALKDNDLEDNIFFTVPLNRLKDFNVKLKRAL